jgi:hypothetical protein
LLKPTGVITLEFPHLMRLMEENQFDTIYHEHFSYFSLTAVEQVFASQGLAIFDVDELRTHGGSLRIYAAHAEDTTKSQSPRVAELKGREHKAGLLEITTYFRFAEKVRETKRKLLEFLIGAKREGRSIAGYGAPAKGNTLLNYCGVRILSITRWTAARTSKVASYREPASRSMVQRRSLKPGPTTC